jgi:hypothetical protein
MQNSLDRLLEGIADALVDVVLPAVDDPFARVQLAACVELLGNVATRVEWRRDLLSEVVRRAEAALTAASAAAPELDADRDGLAPDTSDLVTARDEALARVSTALRWCAEHGADRATGPLVEFAVWHLDRERALLRTGMFRQ